jgi:hypothetical protein
LSSKEIKQERVKRKQKALGKTRAKGEKKVLNKARQAVVSVDEPQPRVEE